MSLASFFIRIVTFLLAWEATIFRRRYSGPVIAITGSVGKTTAKETIGLVIRKAYGNDCLVTPKSLNTEIGVPLTLLGFEAEPSGALGWLVALLRGLVAAFFAKLPKCIVVELGADHPGDIAYLSRLVQPTHAVITNISESHSQFFNSLDAIREEKTALLHYLHADGVAYLNGDDPLLARFNLEPTQEKILVRLHARAHYFASGIKVTLEGTEAVLHHANRTQRIKIRRYGEHHVASVLFAAAIADTLGIPATIQLQAFKELKPLPGRGTLLPGKKKSYIYDESYNAQPAAMEASLRTLGELPATRRIAVLGDMRELKDPAATHQGMGKLAKQYADYIIAVGPQSKAYKADEWFLTAYEAVPSALRQLGPGVIVLVKGSQNTIRLERVVKELMQSPQEAKQLLVRQDDEWLRKP